MRTKHVIALLMGAVMVMPALALPAVAAPQQPSEAEVEAMKAQALADLQAMVDAPSTLTFDEAESLFVKAAMGEEIGEEAAFELIRYLRDHESDEEVQTLLLKNWIIDTLEAKVESLGPFPAAWQQNVWNTAAVPVTLVYAALGLVDSNMLPVPQDVRVEDIYFRVTVAAGCFGGFTSFTCYTRIISDVMALASYDMHYTTDSLLLQLPLAIEIHLHFQLVCFFIFCFYVVTFHLHIIDAVIATNAQYVFAIPAKAGAPATRATDNDIWQFAYDNICGVRFQQGREATSASPVTGTPLAGPINGGPTNGVPGAGDLLATGPMANYVGLQVPPQTPAKPGIPATPPLPPAAQDIVNKARQDYGDVKIRVRGDFVTAGDSTGVTTGFEMSQIRAWNLNLACVRTKDVDTGAEGSIGEPPVSFYYDAGSYFAGGSGNIRTVDYRAGQNAA